MILKFARPDDRQGSLLLVVGLALASASSDSLAEASEKKQHKQHYTKDNVTTTFSTKNLESLAKYRVYCSINKGCQCRR